MRSARTERPGAVRRGRRRRSRTRRVAVRVLLCLLLFAAAAAPGFSAQGQGSGGQDDPVAERLLIGAIVDGREVAMFEVVREADAFLVSLADFVAVAGIAVERASDGAVRLLTPRGEVELASGDLRTIDGEAWLSAALLQERLATRIEFQPRRYALRFDLPWRPGAQTRRTERRTLEAETGPGGVTLSELRLDASWQLDGDRSTPRAATTLGGLLAGGWWRARYVEGGTGERVLREYGWSTVDGNRLYLLGHQRLQLHTLLDSLELTGVQAAWTNQPLELFARGAGAGELLPRRVRSVTTIEGVGPPAGYAVLRVDDRVVSQQALGLQGEYAFHDVHVAPGASRRIEVLVFDRFNLSTPAAVHDHSRAASEYLLPAGAAVFMGGFGQRGNAVMSGLHPTSTGRRPDGVAGFAQGRYGIADGLTLESVVQRTTAGTEGLVSATARLGRHVVLSGATALAGGRPGFMAEVDGRRERWSFRVRSRVQAEGFRFAAAEALEDHLAQGSYRLGSRLEVGVLARRRRLGADLDQFVLPTVSWRPRANLWLRARPDFAGEYRVDASWRPTERLRIGSSHAHSSTFLDVQYVTGKATRVSLMGQTGPRGHRQAALFSWTGTGPARPSLRAGPLLTQGRPGVVLSADVGVRPGVLLAARFESASLLVHPEDPGGYRLSVGLRADLAVSGSRLMPATKVSRSRRTGAISGRLRLDSGDSRALSSLDLEGVPLYLDGSPVSRTDSRGRFEIGSLRSGVYLLEMGSDNLPIELAPVRRDVTVQVEAGAVTRVELELQLQYGVAGRVRIAGRPATGVEVGLFDADGQEVGRGRTDRFGLYRIDAVPVGDYSLRAISPPAAQASPGRPVRIVDDFLFEQDLDLGVEVLEGTADASLTAPAGGDPDSAATLSPMNGVGTSPGVSAPLPPPRARPGLTESMERPVVPAAPKVTLPPARAWPELDVLTAPRSPAEGADDPAVGASVGSLEPSPEARAAGRALVRALYPDLGGLISVTGAPATETVAGIGDSRE